MQQLLLDDATGAVHALHARADQENRVADDGAAERDFHHDQGGRGLVAQQRREDRTDFHGISYCDLSWMAGAICIARRAGNRPASRLAASASTNVASNMEESSWASFAYSSGC